MKQILVVLIAGVAAGVVAQEYIQAPDASDDIVLPTTQWREKIAALAPENSTARPGAPRRILLFSLSTGFKHKVAPYVSEAVKILGGKTGAYEVVESLDIEMFSPGNLKDFDAVVLNNTCPLQEKRDLFFDVLGNQSRTAELEQSLLDFVSSGKGLVSIHGAIAIQNNSLAISEMQGGSFNFHPKRQLVTLDLVEPDHPLLAAFNGKGFIHSDEPYLFHNAYAQKNFRPLLKMDVSKLDEKTRNDPKVTGDNRYVAWIRKQGQGRVFYCGPSHQPESYETTAMLRFLLDGIQYALGDLPCDDSPLPSPAR
jgi:type 1 glutamine amidotransferase